MPVPSSVLVVLAPPTSDAVGGVGAETQAHERGAGHLQRAAQRLAMDDVDPQALQLVIMRAIAGAGDDLQVGSARRFRNLAAISWSSHIAVIKSACFFTFGSTVAIEVAVFSNSSSR